MKIPGDFRYTKEHLWLWDEGGVATCGITDHAQELLDEVSSIELPEPGTEVFKDGILATIESLKSVFDVLSPVHGRIVEINKALKQTPSLLNTSPYVDGWIVKLISVDKEEIDQLMTANQYIDFIS